MASFRVGYTLSSQHNIKLLSKIRNPKNISTFSQIAAISVLKDKSYMQDFVNEAKEFFDSELKRLGYKVMGDGGNFSMLKFDFSIKKEFIFVRDYGHVKGMENYLRITIGTKKQMDKVLEVIKKFNKCQH